MFYAVNIGAKRPELAGTAAYGSHKGHFRLAPDVLFV